jgi:PKD repeat protein
MALLALFCVAAAGGGSPAGAAATGSSARSAALAAASCGTDEFTGAALDDARWDVLRPAGTGPTVADGKLSLPIRNGDLINGTATAENVVLQDAPRGGWVATTKLSTAAIDVNGEQAGLVLWKGEGPPVADNTFAKVVAIQTSNGTRRFEAIWTAAGGVARGIGVSGTNVASLPADPLLRMRSDGRTVTAEFSADDGATWTQIGMTARYEGALRVGAVAIGGTTAGTGGSVAFDRFELLCGPEVAVSASDIDGTAPLAVRLDATTSEAGADLSWDFGDGATATGATTQNHTFTDPGSYRVTFTAKGANGIRSQASTRVTVTGPPSASPLSDEFAGSALDPKWDVRRDSPTTFDVGGGALRLTSAGGDMHGGASARNVVLQALPPGAATATTKIDVSKLTQSGDQVGMVVWRSESPNHFAKVVYNRRSATEYWFERSRTDNGTVTGDGGNTGTVIGSPQDVYLRIKSSGGPNPTLTPQASTDGTTWAAVKDPFSLAGSGPVKAGLAYFGPDGARVAAFDYFRVDGGYALPSAENPCGVDEFTGTTLDTSRWNTIVRENATGYSVADGKLKLRALTGDMFGDRATAQNLVLQDVPQGAWTLTTQLDSKAFDREGQQAGFMIRKDDSTFSKFVVINKGQQGRWFEHIFTDAKQPRLVIGTDTTEPLGDSFPALVRIRVISDGETIRGEYSAEGQPWKPIGRPAKIGSNVKVGVYAADNAQDGPEIPFDYVSLAAQSDEFSGTGLDKCRWSQIVRAADTGYRVKDGKLEIDGGQGEVEDTAPNLIGQPVPAGTWEAETRIDLATTDNGQQAGLLLYKEPANWIKAVLVDKGTTSQLELVRVKDGNYLLDEPFKVDVPSDMSSFRLRLRSDGTSLMAQYSPNGETWTTVGKARDISDLGGGHLGPMALRGPTAPAITAKFDYVRVRSWAPPVSACTPNGTPEQGFARLWSGVDMANTTQAGPGGFDIVNDGAEGCRLQSRGGLGMLWFNAKQYGDFELRMQFKTADIDDNSGVFVRFPNPGTDPNVAISQGLEVQIHEGGTTGEQQKTGSIYNNDPADRRGAAKPPGQWNDYTIRHENNKFTITLNDTVINEWVNSSSQGRSPGYIGIQNHGNADEVSFRNLRIKELAAAPAANLFTTIGITRSETRGNSGIYGNPTPYSFPAEEMPPSRTVGPAPDDTLDNVPLRMPDTSGNVPNLAAFRGQTLTLRQQDQKPYSKVHFFGTTTDGGPAGGDFLLRYSDATTQTVKVEFRDWCGPQDSAAHHVAIGPMSQRYRTTGGDGARCAIYHVPVSANPAKTLVSVTLPSTTTPASPNIQSYLMALTLEEPGGLFATPDLSGSVQFPDDNKAPTTIHAFNPAQPNGDDGWYTGTVRVTLTGTDEAGGSGVEQMMYRIDGGAPQPYGGPFNFPAEGEHTLQYRSVDGAGNAEEYKSVSLKVDGTAPVTRVKTSPGRPLGTDGWYDSAVKLTLTAGDGSGSGTKVTEYRLGDGEWQPYGEPLVLGDAGVYDVEYRSSDVAGNRSDVEALRVKVDPAAPVTSARINGAAPQEEYTGPVRVALTRTDGDGSGAVGTEYRIGDGEWTAYTDSFDIDGNRGHRIDFRSWDVAGNVENFRSVTFVIRPPVAPSGGTPQPPAATPAPGSAPPPRPAPFASLQEPARKRSTIAAFRRGDFAVRVTCRSVDTGTLRLGVSRAVARQLGLKRRVLATQSVRCGDQGRGTVTLKPSGAVKRALAGSLRAFDATLTLRMQGPAGRADDSAPVVLRGKRGR